jgi:hypothetical protein
MGGKKGKGEKGKKKLEKTRSGSIDKETIVLFLPLEMFPISPLSPFSLTLTLFC